MTFSSLFSWLTGFWGAALAKDKYNLPEYVWAA